MDPGFGYAVDARLLLHLQSAVVICSAPSRSRFEWSVLEGYARGTVVATLHPRETPYRYSKYGASKNCVGWAERCDMHRVRWQSADVGRIDSQRQPGQHTMEKYLRISPP
jgi:hypothetical protein